MVLVHIFGRIVKGAMEYSQLDIVLLELIETYIFIVVNQYQLQDVYNSLIRNIRANYSPIDVIQSVNKIRHDVLSRYNILRQIRDRTISGQEEIGDLKIKVQYIKYVLTYCTFPKLPQPLS